MGLKDLLDPYASPHARQEGLVALLAIVGVVVVIAIVVVVILGSGSSSTPSTPAVVAPTETPFATLNPYATPVKTATPADTTGPDHVTDLEAVTITENYIKWTWSDPDDEDLMYIMVYLDNVFKKNVSPETEYYKATDLDGDTEYTIKVRPIDNNGNLGSYREDSATTGATIADVTNLTYTKGTTFVLWTWTDPDDTEYPDFSYVKIWKSTENIATVYEGIEKYNVTGLSPGQTITFKFRAYDTNDNPSTGISQTIITETATATPTASPDTAPGKVTDLTIDGKGDDYVILKWTNPSDSDLSKITIQIISEGGSDTKDVTGLTPGAITSNTIQNLNPDTFYTFILTSVDETDHESGPETETTTTNS